MINDLLTNKFTEDVQHDINFLKENWEDLEFVLSQRYIVLSGMIHYEKVLTLWKEVLLADLQYDRPTMLKDCLSLYFRTQEDFYANRTIEYEDFVDDFFLIINYLQEKINGKYNFF